MTSFEYIDPDLDGDNMFAEYLEHGVEILRRGYVHYVAGNSREQIEFTDTNVQDPADAAYLTFLSRGVPAEDIIGIERQKVQLLGAAIAEVVPDWPTITAKRPKLVAPELPEVHRYYRAAA